MMLFKDAQEAFEAAINKGALSGNAHEKNFAGNYMYMGSQAGYDLFKHVETREYLKVEAD